jgi:hypothetical protein
MFGDAIFIKDGIAASETACLQIGMGFVLAHHGRTHGYILYLLGSCPHELKVCARMWCVRTQTTVVGGICPRASWANTWVRHYK